MKRFIILLIALSATTYTSWAYNAELSAALDSLDSVLAQRDTYRTLKADRLKQLENSTIGASLEQQFFIGRAKYAELASYQFDEALAALRSNLNTARAMKDKNRENQTLIALAQHYTNGGHYIEAMDILANLIDTTQISPSRLTEYRLARQRLANELINYTKSAETIDKAIGKADYYTRILLKELPADSFDYLTLYITDQFSKWNLFDAQQACSRLLASVQADSREYATAAYLQAVICARSEEFEKMATWYARAAAAAEKACIYDNAALFCLATWLYSEKDIDRAELYTRISTEEGSFYNARHRQWQIVSYLSTVEQSARESENRRIAAMRISVAIVSILLLVFAVLIVYLARLYRREKSERATLVERNLTIEQLNHKIIEANHVKEEYLALFVSMCTSYIDKLEGLYRNVRHKISRNKIKELQEEMTEINIADAELRNFYTTFDNAFLHLYPTFVEDFNALLNEGEKLVPHKDERLSPELRIFALIRLGITDSNQIATMLHYSVNTIYNYRAKTKNKSNLARDNFEEAVQHIGSFSKK